LEQRSSIRQNKIYISGNCYTPKVVTTYSYSDIDILLTVFNYCLNSVRKTVGWRTRDIDEIIEDYSDGIFNSPFPTSRQEILPDDLEHHSLTTEDGHENPLYSKDGFQIQRRIARFSTHTRPHGVLLHFPSLQSLFLNEDDELFDEDPAYTEYTVYPQAGLKSVGHFQAKGLMSPCYKLLQHVNRRLTIGRDNDSDMSVDGWEDTIRPAVCGIASQGYNAVMHHTRGRTAQHHDVQVGLITAALAGGWATSDKAKQRATKMIQKCQQSLPHEAFAEKIANPNISRDLRLENVYSIDINALRRHHRNGK
jgi:hypothetical protein